MTKKKMHTRHSVSKRTVLTADLEELMGPPKVHEALGAGDEHFFNNCENDGVRGLNIQSLCYEKGMKTDQFMSEASKTTLD
jgi:hypothetical protein